MEVTKNKELYQSAGEVWHEIQTIKAEYPDGDFPGEVDAKLNTLLDVMDKKQGAARTMERVEKAGQWANAVDTEKRLPVQMPTGETKELEIPYATKRMNALYNRDGSLNTKWSAGASDLVAGDRYDTLLRVKALRGAEDQLPDHLRISLNGLQRKAGEYIEGTAGTVGSSGGYLTPDIFFREFVNLRYVASFVRQANPRVIPLTSDSTRVPTMGTASAAAALVAEVGSPSNTRTTLAEVNFRPIKFQKISVISKELLADAQFPVLETVILPDFAQAHAAAENTYMATGTGTAEPQGLQAAITYGATGSATGSFSSNDVITTYHTLGIQYRQNAKWMFHDNVAAFIRKLVDNSGGAAAGNFLWQPGFQQGQPDRLLGAPVVINNSLDSAFTTGKKMMIIGDFSYFWIGERMDLEILTLNELYAASYAVGFLGTTRWDSHVMQAAAFSGMVLL